MRPTHYQTENIPDIPRGILRKMLFSLENSGLPMLTWKLSDGSVLQIQKDSHVNHVRYWGGIGNPSYVVLWDDGSTQNIYSLYNNNKKHITTMRGGVETTDSILYTAQWGFEWKVGNLIFMPFCLPSPDGLYPDLPFVGRFYNIVTGKLLDKELGPLTYGYVEGKSVYYVEDGYAELKKITPVLSEGVYTFVESSIVLVSQPKIEEGVFFYSSTGVDVIVFDKDTGDIVEVKPGFSGPDEQGWLSPTINYQNTYWDEVVHGIRHGYYTTNFITPFGSFAASYTSQSGYPFPPPWPSYNGIIDFIYDAPTVFGKTMYLRYRAVYDNSSVPTSVVQTLYEADGSIVITNDPLYEEEDYYTASLGVYDDQYVVNDIRGIPDLPLFRIRFTVGEGLVRSQYIIYNNEVISHDKLADMFSLLGDVDIVNINYFPGCEKDVVIGKYV
jgi:hypothetical protein